MCISDFFVRNLAKCFSNGKKAGIISVTVRPDLSGDVRARCGTLLLIDCPGSPWREMGKGDKHMLAGSGEP